MTDYMQLISNLNPLYNSGDWTNLSKSLDDLWGEVPAPKESVLNSHLIPYTGATCGMKFNDLEKAWYWANEFSIYKTTVMPDGQCEFLLGSVAFLRGDFTTARNYFKQTKEISGLRLFKGQNPAYRDLAASK